MDKGGPPKKFSPEILPGVWWGKVVVLFMTLKLCVITVYSWVCLAWKEVYQNGPERSVVRRGMFFAWFLHGFWLVGSSSKFGTVKSFFFGAVPILMRRGVWCVLDIFFVSRLEFLVAKKYCSVFPFFNYCNFDELGSLFPKVTPNYWGHSEIEQTKCHSPRFLFRIYLELSSRSSICLISIRKS